MFYQLQYMKDFFLLGELSDAISESIHQQSIIAQQQYNQVQHQQPQNLQQLPSQQTSITATAEEIQNTQINLHESAFRTIETPPVGNAQAENVEIQNPQPTKTGSLGMFIKLIIINQDGHTDGQSKGNIALLNTKHFFCKNKIQRKFYTFLPLMVL